MSGNRCQGMQIMSSTWQAKKFALQNKQIKAEHFCQAPRGMATRKLTLFPPAEVTAVNRNY